MVLIAAAVLTKTGKILVARTFVTEMPKSRLEGLLEAFPKLVGSDDQRQHTFVETDSVRYVYQPIDDIFVVLVTTKASNILEDLEALRLFSRIIPEYCKSNDEAEILSHAFDLIFAFDEVVALGYRESVNLAMIRTYTEMDSHEERVHKQILHAQMRDAQNKAQQHAKEMQKNKDRAAKSGRSMASTTAISSSNAHQFASVDISSILAPSASSISSKPTLSSLPKGGGRALVLNTKKASEAEFLQQLHNEGTDVSVLKKSAPAERPSAVPAANQSAVHIKFKEKLTASVSRNGGVNSAEVLGSATLNVAREELATVTIQLNSEAPAGTQFQVHPNLLKKVWNESQKLQLKSENKPFPVHVDVGVLKWRLLIQSEEELPISLNVFPNETPDGWTVTIEYQLNDERFTLNDVVVTIPLPTATKPVVSDFTGNYEYVRAKSHLVWSLPVVDASSDNGTLEFSVPNGQADHFFPVNIDFYTEQLFANVALEGVYEHGSRTDVEHSHETLLSVDSYEVV